MHTDSSVQCGNMLPSGNHAPALRQPHFTVSEFLQLGLSRIAYLTRVKGHDGNTDIVIHGADGMAVAVVDTADMADDLAGQLGLVLVPVQ